LLITFREGGSGAEGGRLVTILLVTSWCLMFTSLIGMDLTCTEFKD